MSFFQKQEQRINKQFISIFDSVYFITPIMAKLIGLDRPVMKELYADNKPVVFNITGVSPDEAAQAYRDIMEAK